MIVNSINKLKKINNGFKINNLNHINHLHNNRLFSTSNQNQNQNPIQNNNNDSNNNNNSDNNNDRNDNDNNNNNNSKKFGVEYKNKSYSLSIQFGGKEEDPSYLKQYRKSFEHQVGTEPSVTILEDDSIVEGNVSEKSGHTRLINHFEHKVKHKRDEFIQGIRSILSFMEGSYKPIRNSPLLNPFISILPKKANYLFEKNPFFVIMAPTSLDRLHPSEKYLKQFETKPSPQYFNEIEFLQESREALKLIFKLAQLEDSLALQKISCVPATSRLLLIRDVYYSVQNSDNLDFNVNDISIDNFEFEPIDCKVYGNTFQNKSHLKVETTYRVISNRYERQCKEYPITVCANWLTEYKDIEDIDWKIFGLSMNSDYSPL